jgi:hypothetical protein
VVFADHKVPLPQQLVADRQGLDGYLDKPLIIGLRPSSLEDAAFANQDWPRIKGEVAVTEELGSDSDRVQDPSRRPWPNQQATKRAGSPPVLATR